MVEVVEVVLGVGNIFLDVDIPYGGEVQHPHYPGEAGKSGLSRPEANMGSVTQVPYHASIHRNYSVCTDGHTNIRTIR